MYVCMYVCMYVWPTTVMVGNYQTTGLLYTEQLFSAANSELSIIPAAILHVNYSRDQQETFLPVEKNHTKCFGLQMFY